MAIRHKRISTVLQLIVLLPSALAGCTADSKGEWCGVLDQGFADDETYCPDPDAPKQCESLRNTLIDRFDGCAQDAGLTLTDAQLEEAASALDCDNAKAMSVTEDECRSDIDAAECDGATLALPESCKGVVKSW